MQVDRYGLTKGQYEALSERLRRETKTLVGNTLLVGVPEERAPSQNSR